MPLQPAAEHVEGEQISEPVLLAAQKLLDAAGSLDVAKQALETLRRRKAEAAEAGVPEAGVPETRARRE